MKFVRGRKIIDEQKSLEFILLAEKKYSFIKRKANNEQWTLFEQEFMKENKVPLYAQKGSVEYAAHRALQLIACAYYCYNRCVDEQ